MTLSKIPSVAGSPQTSLRAPIPKSTKRTLQFICLEALSLQEVFRLTWGKKSILPISGLLFYKALKQIVVPTTGAVHSSSEWFCCAHAPPRVLLSGRAEHPPPQASFIPVPPCSRCRPCPHGRSPRSLQPCSSYFWRCPDPHQILQSVPASPVEAVLVSSPSACS